MAPNKDLFSYDNLVYAVAGATGSVTAMTAFYPLDTIRSILQVDDQRKAKSTAIMLKELMQEEGLHSLYKGLGPVLASVCASNFVYFYTFHGLKALLTGNVAKNQSALRDLSFASLAGAINVLTTTPLWVVNTRIKLQGTKMHSAEYNEKNFVKYDGLLDGLFRIANEEGVPALWSGTAPSLLLVLNPGIQLMVYETIKRYLRENGYKNLGGLSFFCIGAVAKTISTIITYPLQVIQSKLRYERHNKRKASAVEMLRNLIRLHGIKGLYKGLEAKLWQTVLTTALMFLCYEKIAAFVFMLMAKKRVATLTK